MFGWVFASHQIGAAIASVAAGVIRDQSGAYTIAWFGAAGMCLVAALVSFQIRKVPTAMADPAATPVGSGLAGEQRK